MPLIKDKNLAGLNLYENIRTIQENDHKDIINIAILNLMPNKHHTEYEFLSIFEKCDEKIKLHFMRISSYKCKNTSEDYLNENYYTLDEIKNINIHGFIVTGAPVEKLDFNEVSYWSELREIFKYIDQHINSSIFICWGAQAALYEYYNIRKVLEPFKIFGIYTHKIINFCNLLDGIENGFFAPHSRHSNLNKIDLSEAKDLKIICNTIEGYEHIIKDNKNRFYIFGHAEYHKNDLKNEYLRDKLEGKDINIPINYFKFDDPNNDIEFTWRKSTLRLYNNWIKHLNSNTFE